MRILIIGEYSGVSKNLKSGFAKLGHSATVFSEEMNERKKTMFAARRAKVAKGCFSGTPPLV